MPSRKPLIEAEVTKPTFDWYAFVPRDVPYHTRLSTVALSAGRSHCRFSVPGVGVVDSEPVPLPAVPPEPERPVSPPLLAPGVVPLTSIDIGLSAALALEA